MLLSAYLKSIVLFLLMLKGKNLFYAHLLCHTCYEKANAILHLGEMKEVTVNAQ